MNKVLQALKKSSPTILSVLACVGVAATAYLAAKAVPKASDRKWAARIKKDPQNDTYYYDNEPAVEAEVYPKLTKKETFLAVAPAYIPAAISCLATMACILGANVLNKKTQASLMSAYMLTNQHFNEYRKAAKEVYGEDADDKIQSQVAFDVVNKDHCVAYVGIGGTHFITDGPALNDDAEQYLFYEPYTKRYFWSTVKQVENAEMDLNRRIILNGRCSVGEFLELLGVPVPEDKYYFHGWNAGYITYNTENDAWLDIRNVFNENGGNVDDIDIPPFYVITYEFNPIMNHEDWSWDSMPF